MKIRLIILFFSLIFAACNNNENKDDSSIIKAKLAKQYPNYEIKSIERSEIETLYEIHGENNIIYTDANCEHIFIGNILSFDGQRNLTMEKLNIKNSENISVPDLDLSPALKIVEGRGEKKVIMVTSPECPYCSMADTWFAESNTTRYIFFMPISANDEISEHILCSENPSEEYKKIMNYMNLYFSGYGEESAVSFLTSKAVKLIKCSKGKNLLEEMHDEILKGNFDGTPTFIVDGKLIIGADPSLKEVIK